MTHYFLNRGIEIFRLGVFVLIVVVADLNIHFTSQPGMVTMISSLAIVCANLFGIIIISQAVNRLHDIYYRVEFWGEYQKKVIAELPDIEPKPVPENR